MFHRVLYMSLDKNKRKRNKQVKKKIWENSGTTGNQDREHGELGKHNLQRIDHLVNWTQADETEKTARLT